MAVSLDRVERAMTVVGAIGGAVMGTGVLIVVGTDGSFVMLQGVLFVVLGMALWTPGALAPIIRNRPWAIAAGTVPAGVAMILAFGVTGLAGWGPTAGRPAYVWGSIVAALAFAAFGIYAHRDGMRRLADSGPPPGPDRPR